MLIVYIDYVKKGVRYSKVYLVTLLQTFADSRQHGVPVLPQSVPHTQDAISGVQGSLVSQQAIHVQITLWCFNMSSTGPTKLTESV